MPWDPCEGATPEARALYDYMSGLSKDCYCAGWMEGTEAACWEAMQDGGTRWGMTGITAEEAAELKRLSDVAGGWWHWPNDALDPVFLSIPEWEAAYERVWSWRRR